MDPSSNYDVIIAGGGPAGSSAAIQLASRGARVLLAEQKQFPRPKLCGEFISPECFSLFERLGVADQMLAARPAKLTETVFYSRNGNSVQVPSSWFGVSGIALGLSRAEMDERLLRRASDAGAQVIEDAHVTSLLIENKSVRGVKIKQGAIETSFRAAVTVDATGRARALTRHTSKRDGTKRQRAPMVAFKAHLENTRVEPGACEIYFYRGGYGGLSSIENGLSNLCFIASASDVRASGADADRVMREVVCQNQRARFTLGNARSNSPWLAVSLEGFGRHSVAPVNGLLAIGDAASFIDPFTGSGMLMALESGELAANAIVDYLNHKNGSRSIDDLRVSYSVTYNRTINSRLKICSLMRKAAFVPGLAEIAVRLFGASEGIRRRLARATRGTSRETYPLTKRVS
jgi:flavin-dependent dehydrogenase